MPCAPRWWESWPENKSKTGPVTERRQLFWCIRISRLLSNALQLRILVYSRFCWNIKHKTEAKYIQHIKDRWLTFIQASNLFCVHDSAHSHSQCHCRHLWEIPIKEPGISHDRVFCQGLHPSPGNQTGARLVEGNVAIWSNTWQDRKSRKWDWA